MTQWRRALEDVRADVRYGLRWLRRSSGFAAAAVLSPTNDIPNMLLFAAPMVVLYLISILVAWLFSRPRTAE